ncbi:MAG: helix-hairpin-helix domain-containing protein [Saprospiraceae bacterium]|nr:helix-hairpin-helix domain-containing protein [Saprospiraceae bacterium]
MRFFDSRLILFFVALYSTAGFGQISLPLDSTGLNTDRFVEDLIQSYIESRSEDGDFDYNTFMDRLESIKKHRVNINDPDQLDDFILLRPSQIAFLKSYIQTQGALISLYELQSVPGFDLNTIRAILPFIALDAGFDTYSLPFSSMLAGSTHQVFLRFGRVLEDQAGYAPPVGNKAHYTGGPSRLYMRYRMSYENRLSVGLTAEKDPGEEFFSGSNRQGFDYYSFHASLRKPNKHIEEIILGDYNIRLGQGLIMQSGFGIGKSPWSTNIRKGERTLSAYSSVNETNFFRGLASNIKLNPSIDATLFVSRRRKDGNVLLDSIDRESAFSSFQESGYHRTLSEIADEDKIKESLVGGAFRYKGKHGHLGLNTVYVDYDKSFQKQSNLYNQFSFTGTSLFQSSVDHSFQWRNFNFFGEYAVASPGSSAFIEGLQLALDKNFDLAVLYRNLDPKFPALYSNAFTESTLATNENGLYVGAEIRPATRWKIAAYWDNWNHPWLKFGVQGPSDGNEQMMRLTYTIKRKMEAYIQYRNKSKEENVSSNDPLRSLNHNSKKSYRFNFNYQWSKSLETRNRIEASHFKTSSNTKYHGWMIYQDLLYHPIDHPVTLSTRLAYYDVENFDAGIYAYENDLLYNFYVPVYSGRGWRNYFNLRYDGIRSLTLEGRYAVTYQPDAISLGSGLDLINGHKRSEVKFQIRYTFH